MKKAQSLNEYNEALKNMKLNVFNQKSNKTKSSLEKVNYENFLKYSCFYNNSKKMGLNMEEITPNIKKNAIFHKNDFFLSPEHMAKHIKSYLTKKNEEKK